MNRFKGAVFLGFMLAISTPWVARADSNSQNKNDLRINLSNGQSASIHWHGAMLMSGPNQDNLFTLTVWNTAGGSDHVEDLNGTHADSKGVVQDFFAFAMTDMSMPDPAKTYQKARKVIHTSQGLYEVTSALFSMDSMMANDWQVSIVVSGQTLGQGTVTVGQ